jgi:aryl-alcohol dehydrogenase
MMPATRSLTAAVSRGADDPLVLEKLRIGAPRTDEVLVQVDHAGICHTDINCHHGKAPTPKPVVLGHEGAGTVVEVGAHVTGVAPGDRVLMTFMTCGRCRICLTGRTSYCAESAALNFLGGRADGTGAYVDTDVHSHFFGQSAFATLSMANVRNVVRVPDSVRLDHAAILGCGVITGAGAVLNSLRVVPGSSVAVFGAGAVGLSAIMAARVAGASTVIAVDAVASRLETATRLGATHTLAAGADVADAITELTAGGVDYSVEASGHPTAFVQAVDGLGSGGVCAAIGMMNEPVAPSWRALRQKGASVRGVAGGGDTRDPSIPPLLRYHAEGRFPFHELITRYDFEKINDAIADAESGVAVKPVLAIGGTR